MDKVFWIGIGLGAMLSLLASVLANLANNRISAFFAIQREKLSFRREAKEKEIYEIARGLRSGKRNIVAYFALKMTGVICLTMGALALSGLALFASEKIGSPPPNMESWFEWGLFVRQIPSLIAMLGFMFGMFASIKQMVYMTELVNKVDNFEEYTAELSTRFPKSNFWKI